MEAFTSLLGQAKAIELLWAAVQQDKIAPAYLFCGAPGIGKSIAARDFARLLLTQGLVEKKLQLAEQKLAKDNHPNLLWVEPTYLKGGELYTAAQAAAQGWQLKTPPKIRIEQIRRLVQFLNRPALEAPRQVVVINDAQTMAEAPANALLKTLEEPGRATLILLAPDPASLLTTLVSRCQKIQFYRLSQANLQQVLAANGHEAILEYPELITLAQGSPGDALMAWSQLLLIPDELLQQLKRSPQTPLEALTLAKQITEQVEGQTQLWLIDYLQHFFWQRSYHPQLMKVWERTRQHLLRHVQPRLTWECTLLELAKLYSPVES